MKWQGPSPRALTLALWGEPLEVVEALQRQLLTCGQDLTLADVVRDLVKLHGPRWLETLKGGDQ